MRKLKINRMDFETAFDLSSYETMAYLDTKTTALIFVEDYVADQLEELLADDCDPRRVAWESGARQAIITR